MFPAAFGVWVLSRRPRFRAVSPRLLLEGLVSGLLALGSVLALYEIPGVALQPAGYAVLALAAAALILDFGPGLRPRAPDDPDPPRKPGG